MKDEPGELKDSSHNYQSVGRITVAPEVLLTICRLTTLNVTGVSRMSNVPGGVNRLFRRGMGEGVRLDIKDDIVYADLYVIVESDYNIRDVSQNVQSNVSRAISETVGMQVGRINIHVDDIDYAPLGPQSGERESAGD